MANENQETVMDAVNAALGEAGGGDAAGGDDSAAGDGIENDPLLTGEGLESEEDPAGDEPDAGDETHEGEGERADGREANGRFKAKDDQNASKDGKPGAGRKEPDPLNDPIPKELKQE